MRFDALSMRSIAADASRKTLANHWRSAITRERSQYKCLRNLVAREQSEPLAQKAQRLALEGKCLLSETVISSIEPVMGVNGRLGPVVGPHNVFRLSRRRK